MAKALVVSEFRRITYEECSKVARALSSSGYFTDCKEAVKAFAKILAGQELGVEPFQAMSNIHIVQGKPVLSAVLLGALVQRSGWASFRVVTHTDIECVIAFTVNGFESVSTFTMDDARKAGLDNKSMWKTYPRNMLYARALSNGVRWYCPGVIGGVAYVPGELEESTDWEGNGKPDKPAQEVAPNRPLSPPESAAIASQNPHLSPFPDEKRRILQLIANANDGSTEELIATRERLIELAYDFDDEQTEELVKIIDTYIKSHEDELQP